MNISGSRSLPAVQAFSRAQFGLDDWDLEAADSLFQTALTYDADYARANLWLAQVRAWEGGVPARWVTLAERALALPDQLSEREQQLARALVLLAHRSYKDACKVYGTLAARNDRDFAALFGLGQCQMMDRLVYADATSPSGWSFHSSARRAMEAYERAFEILPSVHRGYERGAFGRLRVTLLLTADVVIGYGATDSALFYARPGWIGDTLALIPIPWRTVATGKPNAAPPGFPLALLNRREAFRRIASHWSAAYPRSSGAKLAVAAALEMLGNPAAIDTVRLARKLAQDGSHQRQLAAAEVLLLVKFGLTDGTALLRSASSLADSILAAARDVTTADVEVMSQVAMLVGACGTAEELARRIPENSPDQEISAQLFASSHALLARVGSGCRVSDSTVSAFAAAADREYRDENDERRGPLIDMWASRPILLARGRHPEALRLLATATRDPFSRAEWMYARGMVDSARWLFRPLRSPPVDTLTPPTPDITYPRARLAVELGDTLSAIARLDRTLTSVRRYDFKMLMEEMHTASLVQSMVLRADIAMARHDTSTMRRWATAVTILWSHADRELQPEVARMRSYLGDSGAR
jgi:tetratricopeptide (TPR) repeat protein